MPDLTSFTSSFTRFSEPSLPLAPSLAPEDHNTIPDHPDMGVAGKLAIQHVATGDSAHFADFVNFPNLQLSGHDFLFLGWFQEALDGQLDFLDGLVDDRVHLDFHAFPLGQLAG